MKWSFGLTILWTGVFILAVLFFVDNTDLMEITENPFQPEVSAEEIIELNGLHPSVEEKRDRIIRRAGARGIDIVITEEYRTKEEQDALYAQGRTEPGQIVTSARGGESYHNYGLAFDFAVLDEDGEIHWDVERDGNNSGTADYKEVGEIGKDLGLEWGGDWQGFTDYPHFQQSYGWNISDLQRAEDSL